MKKGISFLILSLLVCAGLYGDKNYKYIHSRDADFYFGHVIYPEAKHDGKDAVVLRDSLGSPEVADLNLPIAPGDTIRTSDRRCEIQFDTGTVIRLDRNTELKIETILAQSLSSKNLLTNLLLFNGQVYVMYKRYVQKELFQIITLNTAVKLNHNAVALIKSLKEGGTDVHMSQGRGYALYGPDENAIKKKTIKKSQRITVTPGDQVVAGQYGEIEDFEAWNEKLNREFLEWHEGKTAIPMPIQKLSKGVYYFAQKYSNLYGEWLWDKYLGYVWRPYLNDRSYPGGEWMPYYNGRWTSVQGQLFWVPGEPWGWVPYHLGIWMWNKKKGWLWIPGSVFAPAWVDWGFHQGYFCWRPWSITDWYGYSVYADGYFPYFASLIHPEDDAFYQEKRQDFQPDLPGYGKAVTWQVIVKKQLKKKTPPLPLPYPIPKELKKAYKRIVVAMKDGEEEILATLKETPQHMLVVDQKDLNDPGIHEKIVKFTSLSQNKQRDFLFLKSQQDPYLQARQTYNRNEKIAALREKVTDLIRDREGLKSLGTQEFQMADVIADNKAGDKRKSDGKEVAIQSSGIPAKMSLQRQIASPDAIVHDKNFQNTEAIDSKMIRIGRSSVRFRDWNPDVAVARRAGISIRYSSRSNEVRCPELDISSRHVNNSRGYEGPRVHITSRGAVTATGAGGSIVAGSPTSGSYSRGGTAKAASSKSGNKKDASSGKGGVVKK
jgi:hypothetical protein